jgi:hypothetical protein
MKLSAVLCPVCIALLIGCDGGSGIHTDYDPRADFGAFRSFAFENPVVTGDAAGAAPVPRVLSTIEDAVRRELSARGLQEDGPDPGLQVSISIGVSKSTGTERYGYSWDVDEGGTEGSGEQYQFNEGSLLLDFFDTNTGQLVWRGWAEGSVDRTGEPDLEALDRVVTRILASYPPPNPE